MSKKINIDMGVEWIAIALLIIFFYGDPDLSDALIKFLMES